MFDTSLREAQALRQLQHDHIIRYRTRFIHNDVVTSYSVRLDHAVFKRCSPASILQMHLITPYDYGLLTST